jgi:hypothetical protein
MIAGAATLAGCGIVTNAGAIFREFPGIIEQHREVLASNRAAFAWIAQHETGGAFYAYDDPVFFLYTGHHAASLPVAPMPFYREDREAILAPFRNMPAFARARSASIAFSSLRPTSIGICPSQSVRKCGGFSRRSLRSSASTHGDCPRYIA